MPTKTMSPDDAWEPALTIQSDSLTHFFGAQTTAVDLMRARDHLIAMADDEHSMQSMSRAAAESSNAYDWKNVMTQYFDLWELLVEQRRNEKKDPKSGTGPSSALRFIEDFSFYPTSHLSAEDKFLTSSLGRLLLERKKSIEPYGQLKEFLDLNLIAYLLGTFLDESSLADAIKQLPSEFADDAFKASQNTLWLYKYGYLESP